jgi:hypothetical protein
MYKKMVICNFFINVSFGFICMLRHLKFNIIMSTNIL